LDKKNGKEGSISMISTTKIINSMNKNRYNFSFFLMMLYDWIMTIQSLQAQSYELEIPNKVLKIKINLDRYISFSIDHLQERVLDINRISVRLDAHVLDYIFLQRSKAIYVNKRALTYAV
jgi:hypothetical protein